jgi:hypothetical protein
MSAQVEYRSYRPAGFTDDLGIIADRNQWIPEQHAGWYLLIDPDDFYDIVDWITENNMDHSISSNGLMLFNQKDVILFKLRWA